MDSEGFVMQNEVHLKNKVKLIYNSKDKSDKNKSRAQKTNKFVYGNLPVNHQRWGKLTLYGRLQEKSDQSWRDVAAWHTGCLTWVMTD